MPNLEFSRVQTKESIGELSEFASEIFREYFSTLHTAEKVEYLVKYLLSRETLERAIFADGYEYYFADCDGRHVGFLAVKPHEDYLYLSKLYLVADERGRGFGRQEFEFVRQRARELGLNRIRLNVARDNEMSVARYRHMGFDTIGSEDNEVGGGIQMNDYVMEFVDPE